MKWNNKHTPQDLLVFPDLEENTITYITPFERVTVEIGGKERIIKKLHYQGATLTTLIEEPMVVLERGEKNTSRKVFHYLTPKHISPHLRLGYTKHNNSGGWSSTPHGFENNLEPGFEEVFYYSLSGGSKKGVQVLRGLDVFGEPVDQILSVEDNTLSQICMGYHPIAGEPDVEVSYIWAYLATKKEWEKI